MAAELKTKENKASVTKFLNTIADEKKRKDAFAVAELMKKITKQEAKMWGTAIVGFGSYHYKYASGHEGDMCLIGFSPRKQALVLYIGCKTHGDKDTMKKLGKHKLQGGCLHIKNLDDIDAKVLKELITDCYSGVKKEHQTKKSSSV
jgi:hypothetical protein